MIPGLVDPKMEHAAAIYIMTLGGSLGYVMWAVLLYQLYQKTNKIILVR